MGKKLNEKFVKVIFAKNKLFPKDHDSFFPASKHKFFKLL